MQLTPQPALTPRRRLFWLTTVTVMFALCFCIQLAAAQSLQLSTKTPKAGESIKVTGLELTPGAQVTARLTAPGGRVSRESVQVGDGGRFLLELELPTGGRYQLTVRGPKIERTWQLTVPKPQPKPPATSQNQIGNEAGPLQPKNQNAGQKNTGQSLTPPTTDGLEVTRTEHGVSAAQGSQPWSLTFPAGSGPTTTPLLISGVSGSASARLYLGHGNSVLRLEPQTGNILSRFIVSGPVTRLAKIDSETVGITVRHAQGLLERFTLKIGSRDNGSQNDALQEPVRFGTNPAVFGYLRAEANIPEVTLIARLRRDPTNPWLYLKLGLGQRSETARKTFQTAINRATTFYDLAGLATVLERRGEQKLAATAFDKAMKDFAARDYDPRLLSDGTLGAAYNFPLGPLKRALNAGDDLSAGFWAERLWLAAPNVPGAAAALGEYAALLRQVGTPEQAALWEGRAALKTTTGGALEGRLGHLGLALARNGWQLVPALLAAFVALHLTLLAKYARARRSDHSGGRLPWLFALRYDTLSEKLVLLFLLALTLVCAALGSWAARGEPPARTIGSGTLANRAAQAYLSEAALNGPRAAFVRGTAAQISGDTQEAAPLLRRAGNDAPALNNLGVLTGDQTLYQRALTLEPNLPAARYNTGDRALLPFQATYDPTRPALALPTPADFSAASGNWQDALAGAFTNPQRIFSTPPYGFSLLLWHALQLLFLLALLIHVGFLIVPRPRSAHRAPRSWAYTLLALLFPGTGLADELWGIFLLVPWAVLGTWALLPGFISGFPLTLSLALAGVYLLNTVAVIVEGWSYRSERRLLELRRSRP